jgi:hypothetical protein
MTEAEWLACNDPTPMLEFLAGKAGDRKLRLFACACSRQLLTLLPEPAPREAVEAAERYADGALNKRAYLRAAHAFDGVRRARFPKTATPDDAGWNAVYCAVHRRWESEHDGYFAGQRWRLATRTALDAASFAGGDEAGVQAALLRDIIGNPFRPSALDPARLAWNDGFIPKLAQAIYEERILPPGHLDPVRLPILGDALEDAGWTDSDILGHLHSPGPHVRGCWVVDLLTGQE